MAFLLGRLTNLIFSRIVDYVRGFVGSRSAIIPAVSRGPHRNNTTESRQRRGAASVNFLQLSRGDHFWRIRWILFLSHTRFSETRMSLQTEGHELMVHSVSIFTISEVHSIVSDIRQKSFILHNIQVLIFFLNWNFKVNCQLFLNAVLFMNYHIDEEILTKSKTEAVSFQCKQDKLRTIW